MSTLIYHHPVFTEHDTGRGHPERAERITAVIAALRTAEFAHLQWQDAPQASIEQISLVHPAAFVERILAVIPDAEEGLRALDADTIVSARSGEAALRAAGAVCAGVDAVMTDTANNVFCAVRPPGHHAEPAKAMGFCLFNSIAIGALHALSRHEVKRVAVVDFDVHHGNGTQAAFWDRADCLFISSHQSPLYPGTGGSNERGAHENIVNIPLPPGSGGAELRDAWDSSMAPALARFKPELILISAGFDGHAKDPLASLQFVEADYAWITQKLAEAAAEYSDGRIVAALEGGYDLGALAASAAAHVRVLAGA